MLTGIRFTCLKNGDNLLGQTWQYKNLTDIEAIEEKVKDMFLHVDMLGIDYIIDTIHISKTPSNDVYLPNTGVNGDIWKIADRISLYRSLSQKYNKQIFIELEFPTIVTEYNWKQYARFATEVIDKYSFIKYWQIMTVPELKDDNGNYKCPPYLYVQMMKYIYEIIFNKYSDIKLGAPGIFSAINEYVDSAYLNIDKEVFHKGWLAEAIGELYGTDPIYDLTEQTGFLPYIQFFAFQGDSSTGVFNYNTFPIIISKMKQAVFAHAQRHGLNLDIPFMSTKQGHFADVDNYQDLQLQAYRDLKEYMSDFIVDVIPFKTQLVDEYFNPLDKNAVKNVYGMLYYYLGNDRKPSYSQFSFLINKLKDYSSVCRDELLIKAKRPYDFTSEVQSVMFINDKKDKVLTVIYPANERIVTAGNSIYTKVTLKSAINRTLLIPNGTKVTIDTPTDVVFKNYDFIIVEENLLTQSKTKEELLSEVDLKLRFYETYVKNILSMLPDDYNKEVYDTNFYNLIRAVGIEYGDMRYEMKILDDNMYLSTAHGDAIYNNFGAIVGIKWKPKWSEKQYREAVSGIIESLLHGANKNSIQKAIKSYTGFDVKIYEMFTDYKHYGLTQEMNWDNQYRFTVEIAKDLDDKQELKDVYKEVKEVLEITKPAHTLPIIMIVLVGKEDYRKWYKERYGRDFSHSDEIKTDVIAIEENNKFGWKTKQYDWILKPGYNNFKTNSAYLIGSRYTLYDRSWMDVESKFELQIPKPKDDLLLWLKAKYYDEWNRKVTDSYNMNLAFYFSEIKFGTKPAVTDRILKMNGGFIYNGDAIVGNEKRKLNSHRTGFRYALYDNLLLHLFYTNREIYNRIIKEESNMECSFILKDLYKKIDEEYHIEYNAMLHELKFGYVPYDTKTLMTYKQPPMRRQQRYMNKNRAGIRYRLLNELLAEEFTEYSEKYKKVEESVRIKMYKVDANGNEIIEREE